jgi:hypothetical protein
MVSDMDWNRCPLSSESATTPDRLTEADLLGLIYGLSPFCAALRNAETMLQ